MLPVDDSKLKERQSTKKDLWDRDPSSDLGIREWLQGTIADPVGCYLDEPYGYQWKWESSLITARRFNCSLVHWHKYYRKRGHVDY